MQTKVIRCDHCGEEIDMDKATYIIAQNEMRMFDLCDDCKKEFELFLDRFVEKRQARAKEEPEKVDLNFMVGKKYISNKSNYHIFEVLGVVGENDVKCVSLTDSYTYTIPVEDLVEVKE